MANNSVENIGVEFKVDGNAALNLFNGIADALNNIQAKVVSISAPLDAVNDSVADGAEKSNESVTALNKKLGDTGEVAKNSSDKATQAFQALDRKAKTVFNQIQGYIAPIIAAFGTARLFNNYTTQADELGKLSKAVRMNVQDIDAWAKANEQAGGSQQAFKSALEAFTNRTGRSGKDFLTLGSHIQGMSEAQARYFLRTQGLSKESAAIFLRSKQEADSLVQSFKQTAFTEEDAQNARRFRIAWQAVGYATQNVGNIILRTLMPTITKVMKFVEKATNYLSRHIPLIVSLVGVLGTAVGIRYVAQLMKAVKGLGLVRLANDALTFSFKRLAKAFLLNPIGIFIVSVTALALAIEDLYAFAKGGGSVFEDLLKSIGASGEEIESMRQSINDLFASFAELGEVLKPLGELLLKIFGEGLVAVVKVLTFALASIALGLKKIIDSGKTLTNFVKNLPKAWDDFKKSVAEKLNEIASQFDDLGQKLRDVLVDSFLGAFDSIVGFFNALFSKFIEIIVNPIKNSIKNLFKFESAGKVAGSIWDSVKGVFSFGSGSQDTAKEAQGIASKAPLYNGGTQNEIKVDMQNNFNTADNPQAIGEAVGRSTQRALSQASTLISNRESGTILKG